MDHLQELKECLECIEGLADGSVYLGNPMHCVSADDYFKAIVELAQKAQKHLKEI